MKSDLRTYIATFKSSSYLCSSTIVQGINIMNSKYIEDIKKLIFNTNYITITLQNVSKSGYNTCLKLGFKDIFRAPGKYVSSPYSNSSKKIKQTECISIMIHYGNQPSIPSLTKTLSLLKNFITDKTVCTKVPINELGQYFCINPTTSITLHKLYIPLEVNETTMIIRSDKGYKLIIKKDRFTKIIT